jgi:integrase
MLAATEGNNTLRGQRNRALLLLGFAGAFRRSELVALDVEDLEFQRNGVVVTLRRSKTDQEGESRRIGVPYGSSELTCPVRALQGWLELGAIIEGPVFRAVDRHGNLGGQLGDHAVARLVKEHAVLVGLDPTRYAGHSLRAGLATSAADGGASDRAIMRQTGHRSAAMVNRYVREGRLFRDNAALLAGL